MNELVIRTDKDLYISGDCIYGAVYVNISSPTAATGVQLSFKGYASYMYQNLKARDPGERDKVLHRRKDYFGASTVHLYNEEEPLQFGQYVFPFRKKLPRDFPGSTNLCSDDGWEIQVQYSVVAKFIEAGDVKSSQKYGVRQEVASERLAEFNPPEAVSIRVKKHAVFKSEVEISARLDKNIYGYGDRVRLSLNISDAPFYKQIKSITYKLVREVHISHKKQENVRNGKGTTRIISPTEDLHTTILPEGGAYVVWEKTMHATPDIHLDRGLKGILIPLRDDNNVPVPPTTYGHLVYCSYHIDLVICIDGQEVSLTVPVPCVSPEPIEQWRSFVPSDWMFGCRVMPTMDCSVSQEELESEVFAAMPGFRK